MSPTAETVHRSLVVGNDSPVTRAVIAQLEAAGNDVATVELPDDASHEPDMVRTAFEAARAGRDVRLVVYTDVPAAAAVAGPIIGLDLDGWDRACESVVRRTLLAFQAAHRILTTGGSIILVVPTMALDGSAGFVPWSAAAEAQRVLAKVAARRWRSCDITVNTVAVARHLLCDDLPDMGDADTDSDEATEAASVVCMLAGRDADGLTGATVVADGGKLMAP